MIPACPAAARADRGRKFRRRRSACDTHAHVFGPATRFPYAEDRSYTPPDAPLEKYLRMLDTLGFDRGVLVQGSAHGRDNSAMLDALARNPKRLRGVAVADETCRSRSCGAGTTLGVRGAALQSFLPRRASCTTSGGVTLENAKKLAPVMKDLGWHMQLWIDVKDLPDTIPIIKSIGLPVVIDHMGRTDARAGIGTPGFQSLLRLLGEGGCWVKMSGAHRLSTRAPDYPDARRVPSRRWSRQIRTDWSGAPTGRIRASRARCRTPGICSICSTNGRRTRRCGSKFWSTIRRGFTASRRNGPTR